MNVTLEQMMKWNRKIPLFEYETLLGVLEKKRRYLRNACITIQDEEDSLTVLEDEKGSERWQGHEKRRLYAVKRAERLRGEIQALEEHLFGPASGEVN